MRVQSSTSELVFESPYWTNEETLGDIENTDPAADLDTKWQSFYSSPVEAIRGCMGGMAESDCKVYEGMGEYSSLKNIFADTPVSSTGLRFDETEDEMLGWLAANGMTCADTSGACNWFAAGINLDDDQSSYQARVRFGLL